MEFTTPIQRQNIDPVISRCVAALETTGVLAGGVWWRVLKLPSVCTALINFQTNLAMHTAEIGGFVQGFTLQILCEAQTRVRINEIGLGHTFASKVFTKARIVHIEGNGLYLDVCTNVALHTVALYMNLLASPDATAFSRMNVLESSGTVLTTVDIA